MFRIEVIAEELRSVVAELDPATFAGRDAARLTKVCAEVERLGAAAKVLFARRAVETNGWVHESRAVSGEQWLADTSGCSEFQARDALKTAVHARAKRERHLRTWRQGMATHGTFSGPTEDVDVILRALEPLAQARFEQARTAGEHEP